MLTHSATVLSYHMALIITSLKLINPYTIVCPYPGSVTCCFHYRNVFYFTYSFVYHYVFITVYLRINCIDLFSFTAAMVSNKLAYYSSIALCCSWPTTLKQSTC